MKKIIWIFVSLFVSCAPKAQITKIEIKQPYDRKQYETFGSQFAISSQGVFSSNAAYEIMEKGGNLFDAAVALGFAISVERPQSTGLGGGGFMLLHHAESNKTVAIDFREKAPLKATKTMYQDEQGNVIKGKSNKGIFSVGVPGMVAGLIEIHEKYGKLPLDEVVQPAIDLALKGFEVYEHLEKAIDYRKDMIEQSPYMQSIFYNENGTPKKIGDTIQQKDLAKTLIEIQTKGKDGFYVGWVADAIVEESKKRNGLLTHEDLEKYNVRFSQPVWGSFKGQNIASMPSPSSGGTHLIQIFNILEHAPLRKNGPLSPKSIHFTASAMQLAFADRAVYMGDADFTHVPTDYLISKQYGKDLFNTISMDQAKRSDIIQPEVVIPKESQETAHYSMMDIEGNAIAMTSSINYWLGSGVVVEGTGIVLNNEMDDFAAKPGVADSFGIITSDANQIEPEKRPLSSMSPTLVFDKKGSPVMAFGTPDGSRIISCMTQTFLNIFEYKMDLFDAITTLRYHHQWYPDEIRVEGQGFDANLIQQLENLGYKVNNNNYVCKVEVVAKKGKRLHAVADIRGEGSSIAK